MRTQRSDQYYIQFRLQPMPGQSSDVPARKAVIEQAPYETDGDKVLDAMYRASARAFSGNMAPRNAEKFTALCQADPVDFAALAGWLKSHGYLGQMVDDSLKTGS